MPVGPGRAPRPARRWASPSHDPALEEEIASCLDRVEADLRDAVFTADPVLSEVARHLIDAGGKRFRPLLVALAAQFGDAGATRRGPGRRWWWSSPTWPRCTTTT